MEHPQASIKMCRSSPAVGDPTGVGSSGAGGVRVGAVKLRYLRPSLAASSQPQPIRSAWTGQTRTALGGPSERRRLERDLHDGVQSELVALIIELAVAQDDPDTPPAVAEMLAGLEARAQAALDSVRDVARGVYPTALADFGVGEALRAQASRAAIDVTLLGTPPRGSEDVEEALYFACSEAIQNVAKHAGAGARLTVGLHHHRGSLTVQVADDGRGFDPKRAPEGAGLRNIRDRIEDLCGTVTLKSNPGRGTILTLWLPWPPAADRQR